VEWILVFYDTEIKFILPYLPINVAHNIITYNRYVHKAKEAEGKYIIIIIVIIIIISLSRLLFSGVLLTLRKS
jgi:hypothetical protein